jgi:ketosteroid isomerase-like protein
MTGADSLDADRAAIARAIADDALAEYFRRLFLQSRFTFQFTSSDIQIKDDIALERVTYDAVISPLGGAPSIQDTSKGLHVYRRQRHGSWKLTLDIWNSDGAP